MRVRGSTRSPKKEMAQVVETAQVISPSRRPRVAIVAPSLEILGGQGVQAATIGRGLRDERYEVVFIPVNPGLPARLRWVRGYRYARTVANEAIYLASLRRLRGADVAHVFSASYWSFVRGPLPALVAARSLGLRVVLNYHSGEAEDHLAHWGRLVHPWLRLAHEIVVPSEYLRQVFAQHGFRTSVIPNVVTTSLFPYRERLLLRPRLLSTRNLEPHYRVDDTLRAFALLEARYPEATLTVAGYGGEEGRLRRLAASLGTGGIRFVGRVDPGAMPRLYEAADVFVNSSVVDNQPLSILEAFAAGLSVVSTSTGDISSLVRHEETGLLVPQGDPAAMAAAVGTLLEDPERARLMARLARQELRRFTWPQVRAEWAAVYAGSAS